MHHLIAGTELALNAVDSHAEAAADHSEALRKRAVHVLAHHGAARAHAQEDDDLPASRLLGAHEHDRALAGHGVLDHVAATGTGDRVSLAHPGIVAARIASDNRVSPRSVVRIPALRADAAQ